MDFKDLNGESENVLERRLFKYLLGETFSLLFFFFFGVRVNGVFLGLQFCMFELGYTVQARRLFRLQYYACACTKPS